MSMEANIAQIKKIFEGLKEDQLEVGQHLFHGGCWGCTQQANGFDACKKCCYLEPDWSLPSMNNKKKTATDFMREALIKEKDS